MKVKYISEDGKFSWTEKVKNLAKVLNTNKISLFIKVISMKEKELVLVS